MKKTVWYVEFGENTIEIGSEEAEESAEALGKEAANTSP